MFPSTVRFARLPLQQGTENVSALAKGSGHSKLCLVLAQESFFPPLPEKRWSPPPSHRNPEETREPKTPLIKEQLHQGTFAGRPALVIFLSFGNILEISSLAPFTSTA